ncbi:MAG TPA: alpha/beta hydrolase [Stackebrandtia sp.]|jgi:non-heme chloroperoxidase|uniref:alpha/beta fold hydrolase n=1 Tax=Stackebrandtia sp. TaxID=2023065 RepID=UPI002D32C747|nr:alpha/beta hydrolase [Stackebrandtia sp.]HZE37654.1 alpha/beta hydrolase [Stackebrandtia sp.]
MPFIETRDGSSLFYRDWGHGRPVLFCSSWGLNSGQFQGQMAHLVANGSRVVAYDRRGHGRSDDPGEGYDYDTLADDLADVIAHLDLGELTLIGHSMGCGEIVRYLARQGGARVRKVVLLGAALPFLMATPDNADGVAKEDAERMRSAWRQDFSGWLRDNEGPYFGEGLPGCEVSDAVRFWTLNAMVDASLHALVETNRAVVETDFRAELGGIEVPTLIIHGDHDASNPLEFTAERVAKLLPHSELRVYENAPHGLYLTHPERLNRDLLEAVTAG